MKQNYGPWVYPTRRQHRTRRAISTITLIIAFMAALLFASLAAKSWANVTAMRLDTSHFCGAC